MVQIGTLARLTRERTFDEGNFRGHVEFMIENDPAHRPAPQAYLVHQQPGWVLPVHFHLQDQFQVVVGGSGTLGPHVLKPGAVHFASRESGYGPITAGPGGLDYLTLRETIDFGVWYLPESRARMQAGLRKRQATVFAGWEPGDPPPASECVVVAADSSSPAVWKVAAAAGERIHVEPSPWNTGRFYVVMEGVVRHGDTLLPRLSCLYVSPASRLDGLVAAPGSKAQVLVLQFPQATHMQDAVAA